jgi:co-chaperonin GroES (HSP10)
MRMETMFTRAVFLRTPSVCFSLMLSAGLSVSSPAALAQAPAAAPAAARQLGTVKAISGNSLTLTTDAGQQVAVGVADAARILQLAPGSTDLKSAQAITLADIAVGDRVLVTGKAGDDAGSLTASRVILMKSGDIAQKNEAEKADWQKRGSGGLVSAVDVGTGTLTVSAGAKKMQVQTSGSTKFRRYAGDSVKFEDTKPGTLAQIQAGDQLRVRGAKSEDGSSIQAEEVVSGSFKNLAGTIATIDAASGTLTLKDLATKRTMTVKVTTNSDVRKLPAQAAAMFAARAKGGAPAAGANGGAQSPGSAGQAGAVPQRGPGGMGAGPGAGGPGGMGRSAGMDLSQMLSRLPNETIGDLKVGDAVMIVASQTEPGSATVTAVTLLAGVEPILAATPSGAPAMTLSPWSVGGGGPEVAQ